MACFLVPAAEAVVVSAVKKAAGNQPENTGHSGEVQHITLARKAKWLTNMLWGGSALLAFEHVWHGEVTPWFPFLTAMNSPAEASEMFAEMSTVGVAMAAIITVVWVAMVLVTSAMEKKANRAAASDVR